MRFVRISSTHWSKCDSFLFKDFLNDLNVKFRRVITVFFGAVVLIQYGRMQIKNAGRISGFQIFNRNGFRIECGLQPAEFQQAVGPYAAEVAEPGETAGADFGLFAVVDRSQQAGRLFQQLTVFGITGKSFAADVVDKMRHGNDLPSLSWTLI